MPAKYGIAAGLAAAAAGRWVPQDVISAAFVALICSRPAVVSALREGREQVLASLLGGAIAVLAITLAGPGPVALGLAAAATWAFASALAWGYPAVVVALFSVVYMGALTHGAWESVAITRFASLGIGIGCALLVNLLAAPLLGRANVAVRLNGARSAVRGLLGDLARATRAADPAGVAAVRAGFDGLYAGLGAIRGELVDLRADSLLVRGWVQRPGDGARDRATRSALALEQVAHHAQDAAEAIASLLTTPEDGLDGALLAEAADALEAAASSLDHAAAGRLAETHAMATQAAQRVRERDATLEPPAELARRLGPRLVLLVALAALLDRIARASEVPPTGAAP